MCSSDLLGCDELLEQHLGLLEALALGLLGLEGLERLGVLGLLGGELGDFRLVAGLLGLLE